MTRATAELAARASRFASPSLASSVWQLMTSVGGWVFCVWTAMQSLDYSYALTAAAILAGAIFFVRLFIIQHDCGHGAFFVSRRANAAIGRALGVATLTPFADWRKHHAIHHATSGNLDERGIGDIDTLTVREYLAASSRQRLAYRIKRHPLTLFVVAPAYQFFVRQRFPGPRAAHRERISVVTTTLMIGLVLAAFWRAGTLTAFLVVSVPMAWLAAATGVWLFYVQHQFETAYWKRSNDWTFEAASIAGSSFYDLPRWLHWCTGNIGYHHVHHLCPKIPNYRLRACAEALHAIAAPQRLSLIQSFACVRLALWDEERGLLVSFRDVAGEPLRRSASLSNAGPGSLDGER